MCWWLEQYGNHSIIWMASLQHTLRAEIIFSLQAEGNSWDSALQSCKVWAAPKITPDFSLNHIWLFQEVNIVAVLNISHIFLPLTHHTWRFWPFTIKFKFHVGCLKVFSAPRVRSVYSVDQTLIALLAVSLRTGLYDPQNHLVLLILFSFPIFFFKIVFFNLEIATTSSLKSSWKTRIRSKKA